MYKRASTRVIVYASLQRSITLRSESAAAGLRFLSCCSLNAPDVAFFCGIKKMTTANGTSGISVLFHLAKHHVLHRVEFTLAGCTGGTTRVNLSRCSRRPHGLWYRQALQCCDVGLEPLGDRVPSLNNNQQFGSIANPRLGWASTAWARLRAQNSVS